MNKKVSGEPVVKDIRRRTRKKYSSEEKIRIVLDGLRGEESIANLCRHEVVSFSPPFPRSNRLFILPHPKFLALMIIRKCS